MNKRNKPLKDFNQIVDKKIRAALVRTIELKWWTQVKTSTAADYNGAIYDLSLVAQGDTDQTRDGDRLRLESIEFRLDVQANVLLSLFRVVIFQYFGADTPIVSNVFLTVGQAEIVHAPIHKDIFASKGGALGRVLHDEVLQVDSNGTVALGTAKRLLHVMLKGGFRPNVQFQNTTTTGTNKIYVAVCSDRVTTSLPLFRFYSELRFTDA